MKKLFLIIILIMAIFQLVVLATAIYMGSDSIDRAGGTSNNYTYIEENNAANADGTITSIEIYVYAQTANLTIAIFELVNANQFTVRDSYNVGVATTGYHQYDVSLNVVTGDYIGFWCGLTGGIDLATNAGIGMWFKSGNQTGCTATDFTHWAEARTISIEGTGVTIEAPAGNAIMFGINL